MAEQIDVLLYGLGAIGSFYAFILHRSGNVRLTVVARSNYDAVKRNGITIKSEIHGEHAFRPFNVVRTPSEAPGHYDYIVCAHKATDQDEVPKILAPAVDDKTSLVIIQNGVGNEEPFRKSFPKCSILTCVTWVGAKQPTHGIIEHNKNENMQIGLYPNAELDSVIEKRRLDVFVSLLKAGNTVFEVEEDMQVFRWEKVVWNAAWNSLTTLTMLDTRTWLESSEDAMRLTRELMREVIEVGRKCNVPLKYELIDELIGKILAMPGIGSSMQVDCKNKKPLEVDVILGVPVRKGRELGVQIPALEVIYTLTVGVDYGLRQGKL